MSTKPLKYTLVIMMTENIKVMLMFVSVISPNTYTELYKELPKLHMHLKLQQFVQMELHSVI